MVGTGKNHIETVFAMKFPSRIIAANTTVFEDYYYLGTEVRPCPADLPQD